jgi:hypothetical protein
MADFNFDITNFKAAFGSGARSYLFYWTPAWPSTVSTTSFGPNDSDARYLVRSTNLPGDNVEEIVVNWQGADLKMPGKRTMGDWTITLNVDRKSNIRTALDEWMNATHNLKTGAYGLANEYVADQHLDMLDYKGEQSIRSVKITDAWIKSVGTIELDYSNQEIAQFDITFGYLHHTMTKEQG